MYTGFVHSHSSLAYLLALASTLSLLLAVINMVTGPKDGALKVAWILRIVETAVIGLVGVFGIGMWVMMWPIGLPVAWVGLAIVVLSSMVLARGVKPALKAVRAGETGKSGAWLGAALVQWCLVMAGIGAMQAML